MTAPDSQPVTQLKYLRIRGFERPSFCEKCGTELVGYLRPTGRFNPWDGHPIVEVVSWCENHPPSSPPVRQRRSWRSLWRNAA